MSVSVRVAAQRDADGKLAEMVDFKLDCDKLGLTYPPELSDYFKNTEVLNMSDRATMLLEAVEVDVEHGLPCDVADGDVMYGDVMYGDGMTIDLTRLPKDIKRLRVYCDC